MANTRMTTWDYSLLVALSGVLVFVIASAHPLAAVDDAFITYRYADNLRHGLGFVYNSGEAVLGTTTPLFGLLLGTIGWLFSGVEMASIGFWLSGVAWIASVWMTAFFFIGLRQPITALIAALFVAIQPVMLSHLGMETSLVIFFMLASAWAWHQERWVWAVVCSALLILTRQDGALWVLLLGAEAWRRQKRLPWKETVTTIALCLPWFVFAWWRYGNILPNSVLAKAGQTQSMAASEITPVWQYFWDVLIGGQNALYAVLLVAVMAIGVFVVARHQRQLWWLPIWGVLYLVIYQILGVISFGWYFLPPLIAASLLAALGLGAALDAARTFSSGLRWPVFVILLITLIFLVSSRAQLIMAERVRFDRTNPQLSPYHKTSQWLADNTVEDALVATIEIGIIGYHIPNPILDTMGLVSPGMRPALTGWSDSLMYAMTSYWPDYAIVLPGTAWDGVISQWWFQEYYVRAAQFDKVSVYQKMRMPTANFVLAPSTVYATGLVLQEVHLADQSLAERTEIDAWFQFVVYAQQPSNYQFTYYWIDTQTGERFALETIWPFYLEGAYPSDHWPMGQTIHMPIRLSVPENLSAGTYRLGLFVYNPNARQGLALADAPDLDYPEVQIGYFRLGDPPISPRPVEMILYPLQARWQDGIELVSVGVPDHHLRAGDVLPIRLDWQSYAETEHDLTVFVHVLNEAGEIVVQNDRRPYDGRFPTPVWRTSEELSDTVLISLPHDMIAGSYSVRVGLYDMAGRLGREFGVTDSVLIEDVFTIQDAP